MGEYVKASTIRPGDYISSLGSGFMCRKVQEVTGGFTRQKTNDGPWEDKRVIIIKSGNFRYRETGASYSVPPESMVYRTYKRPTVVITDNDEVIVNGIPAGKIVLKADDNAFEYMQRNYKQEIIGGPRGYVWHSFETDGTFAGKAISYEECLDGMVKCALMDAERRAKA